MSAKETISSPWSLSRLKRLIIPNVLDEADLAGIMVSRPMKEGNDEGR